MLKIQIDAGRGGRPNLAGQKLATQIEKAKAEEVEEGELIVDTSDVMSSDYNRHSSGEA